jgi:hypothetical protein
MAKPSSQLAERPGLYIKYKEISSTLLLELDLTDWLYYVLIDLSHVGGLPETFLSFGEKAHE